MNEKIRGLLIAGILFVLLSLIIFSIILIIGKSHEQQAEIKELEEEIIAVPESEELIDLEDEINVFGGFFSTIFIIVLVFLIVGVVLVFYGLQLALAHKIIKRLEKRKEFNKTKKKIKKKK